VIHSRYSMFRLASVALPLARALVGRLVVPSVCAAGIVWASEPIELSCQPRKLCGIPGEPLRVELSARSPHARPFRVHVPAVTNAVLTSIESVPIQRTPDGQFVRKRILLWQGTEAGSSVLTNLCTDISGTNVCFPPLEVTITDVSPALPPATIEAK